MKITSILIEEVVITLRNGTDYRICVAVPATQILPSDMVFTFFKADNTIQVMIEHIF